MAERPSERNSDEPLDLTLIEEAILNALMFRERYGLEIMHAIAQASKGERTIGFSSLYPTLRKLERRGFVTSRWGEEAPEATTGARRRYYKITGFGLQAIEKKQQFLTALQHLRPVCEEV
ncbi:MAG: helix-turn-helix transcriptional regulator [Synechococcales cyanobacterium M58_A2018_015]|nr:helix-turn-helix transcriptional regulator [Synechococcales cyanobacterium M58_A2018_015]